MELDVGPMGPMGLSLPVTQATRHPGTSGMPEILLVPRGIVFIAIY